VINMSGFQDASDNDSNESFYCPITGALMVDPVIDTDGNTWERSAIAEWITRRGLSPITRNSLSVDELVPNRALKDAIDRERNSLAAARSSSATAVLDINSEDPSVQFPELQLRVDGVPYSDIDPSDTSGDVLFLSNIISTATRERTPTDIVVCIDISGSMDSEASAAGVESSGLSMLDIVKHAVRTIVEVLNPCDRLGVVAWSSGARVVTELTSMSARGKQTTISKVNDLQVEGMTNIWDGLKAGLDLLDGRTDTIVGGLPGRSRNASVFLLTDGVPNIEPPRGYIPTMQRYKDQHGGKYPGIVNTFGFGYSLKSDLLSAYASEGSGTYAFIPDSGFVGTIFVNALANCLTTVTESAVLSVSCDANGANMKSLSEGDVAADFGGDEIVFSRKTVQNGQAYGSVVRVSGNSDISPDSFICSLKYHRVCRDRGREELSIRVAGEGSLADTTESVKQEVALEAFRYLAIEAISFSLENFNENDIAFGSSKVRVVIALIKEYMERHVEVPAVNYSGEHGKTPSSAHKRLKDLLVDLEGQILEAISTKEYFEKWGGHYLRSIRCAHERKQCNNFKDPGVQHYGNVVFGETRDAADDAFSSLPPPVPCHRNDSYRYGASRAVGSAAPMSMSSWNRPDNVCFHEVAKVHMLNGGRKFARDVHRGDILEGGGRVRCVVKTIITTGYADLVRLPCGLLITPWHPVKLAGQWVFPVQAGSLIRTPCEAVYSFLVEKDGGEWPYAESLFVDGAVCATLAHGIQDTPTVSHDFFGNLRVVEALQQCEGWNEGIVTFQDNANGMPGFLVREANSGMVVDLITTMALSVESTPVHAI